MGRVHYNYVYGPVPSRRMGLSVGIEPIPADTCNYSCVYCQLGRTGHMSNERKPFFEVGDMLSELEMYLKDVKEYDVVTLVGDGEPTLFKDLGDLIRGIKKITDKPVAVITNGALLYEKSVREDLMEAHIVLPSLDAYDEASFKAVNRPYGTIRFDDVFDGLKEFSSQYKGQLWIEIMLVKGMNDSQYAMEAFKKMLGQIKYEKVFINAPVRPPAESYVETPNDDVIEKFARGLKGYSINHLTESEFSSGIKDDFKAVLSIIGRHPMNQHEIASFIKSRGGNPKEILARLDEDEIIDKLSYKGYVTYRMK